MKIFNGIFCLFFVSFCQAQEDWSLVRVVQRPDKTVFVTITDQETGDKDVLEDSEHLFGQLQKESMSEIELLSYIRKLREQVFAQQVLLESAQKLLLDRRDTEIRIQQSKKKQTASKVQQKPQTEGSHSVIQELKMNNIMLRSIKEGVHPCQQKQKARENPFVDSVSRIVSDKFKNARDSDSDEEEWTVM